jgi:putative sigma-54 modulation protein
MPIGVEICQDKICPGSLQLTQFYLEKIVLKINLSVQPYPRAHLVYKALSFIVSLIKNGIFMNVNIQTVHFDADGKLVNYVNKKMSKLNTFHDRIIKVDVFLKLDNVVHNIKDKIAEIRVHVPKHHFFVKCSSKSFEESFDSAFESLVNQVKRQKEKQVA